MKQRKCTRTIKCSVTEDESDKIEDYLKRKPGFKSASDLMLFATFGYIRQYSPKKRG